MTNSVAILGRGGVGKTFIAAHLARSFGYFGEKTLLVGCDLKRDTTHAVTQNRGLSLIEALETVGFDYNRLDLAEVVLSANEHVDVMELGPSALLVGQYETILEEALHVFQQFGLESVYSRIVFDVNDDRFDAAIAPLFRYITTAIAITDDAPESFFVLNRLLRAALIGAYELSFPMRVAGAVHNRALDGQAFDQFVQRTNVFPLLSLPNSPDLAQLRQQGQTLFDLKKRTPEQGLYLDKILKMTEILRGEPFNLFSMAPMDDDEIWEIGANERLHS